MLSALLAAGLVALVSSMGHEMPKECADGDQAGYRGYAHTTATGKTCQRWDVNSPSNTEHNQASKTVDDYEAQGLGEHNYCRNPYQTKETQAWCYTDSGKEACAVPSCNPSCGVKFKFTGTQIGTTKENVKNFETCKAFCKLNPDCKAVQYGTSGADDKKCKLFNPVTDSATAACTDCVSAYRSCFEQEPCDMDIHFGLTGIDKTVPGDSMAVCKEQCLQMEGCQAVSWDSTDNTCKIRNNPDYSNTAPSTDITSAIRSCFQREGYRVTCDSDKTLCPKLAKDMHTKGARLIVSHANKESMLHGTMYANSGVHFGWRIMINHESKSEYGKGEAWMEGCDEPRRFPIHQDNIDGAWDFKFDDESGEIYFNGEIAVDFPFLDECNEKLRNQEWNGITLKMLRPPMKVKVGVPPAGFDEVGAWPMGGKACSYGTEGCKKLLLPKAVQQGIAIWPATMKQDAVVKFAIYAKSGDVFNPVNEVMVKLDSAAPSEKERGLAKIADCGPYRFEVPYEVRTLSGEWIIQFSDSALLVWWNKMPLLELPYSEQCLASILVNDNGRKKVNPAFAGIGFKDVDFDLYFGYPSTDLNECKWDHYSDMQCRPADKEQCAREHTPYCACGRLPVQEGRCSEKKPEKKYEPCHCEGKRCFWAQEPGMCHMSDNMSCARRVFSYCSCGNDHQCDGERRPPTEKGYCMDYECYGGGSSGVIASLLLLAATLYCNIA